MQLSLKERNWHNHKRCLWDIFMLFGGNFRVNSLFCVFALSLLIYVNVSTLSSRLIYLQRWNTFCLKKTIYIVVLHKWKAHSLIHDKRRSATTLPSETANMRWGKSLWEFLKDPFLDHWFSCLIKSTAGAFLASSGQNSDYSIYFLTLPLLSVPVNYIGLNTQPWNLLDRLHHWFSWGHGQSPLLLNMMSGGLDCPHGAS